MRLIDADALKKVIEHYQNKRYRNREEDFAIWDAFKRALIIIDNAPTIETKECPYSCEKCAKKMICELGKEMERPQGEWIKEDNGKTTDVYRCSICGRSIMLCKNADLSKYPFCHCGADMRKGGADNEKTDK